MNQEQNNINTKDSVVNKSIKNKKYWLIPLYVFLAMFLTPIIDLTLRLFGLKSVVINSISAIIIVLCGFAFIPSIIVAIILSCKNTNKNEKRIKNGLGIASLVFFLIGLIIIGLGFLFKHLDGSEYSGLFILFAVIVAVLPFLISGVLALINICKYYSKKSDGRCNKFFLIFDWIALVAIILPYVCIKIHVFISDIRVIVNKNIENKNIENRNTEENETGYFYREPSSVEDITYIDIAYNNGKDYVQIVDNEIRYGGFDENGNYKYENVKEDGEFAQDIKKYIYKNNLKYMDREYSSPNKVNWELTINVTGGGCSIGGKDEQPEWFNVLLKKLEVDKYKNTYYKEMIK